MRRASAARAVWASALLWAAAASSAASAGSLPEHAHRSAPLWRDLGHQSLRRAHDLLEQALSALREANRQLPSDWRAVCNHTLGPGFGSESLGALRGRQRALHELARQALRKRAHVEAALIRLQRAVALAPNEPEILYALGRALMAWEQPGPPWECSSQRRDQEAIGVMEQLRRSHPSFAAEAVRFDLAVLLTRQGQFAEAANAYAEAISLALDQSDTAVMRANLAEVTMLAGDLERAVEHYDRALRISTGGRDYLLALWGRAVALDRMGEHDSALTDAQKATEGEAGHMQVLRSDGVFFEPAHEIDYYEGLGHEALAGRPDAERRVELAASAASFQAFIAAAGAAGPFTPAARASLERVQQMMQKPPTRAK
jgi:tetratricopeptide (TPR) repeat protein